MNECTADESLKGFMAEIDDLDRGIDKVHTWRTQYFASNIPRVQVVLLAAELDAYSKQLGVSYD